MARKNKAPKEPKGPKFERACEEIEKMVARLIDDHHSILAEASFSLVMRNGTWKKKGEIVEADVSLISGVSRFELGKEFRITINTEVWNNANEALRNYILDKQLCRCTRDITASGETRWSTIDPYIREFPALIKRYGLITDELRQLDRAMKQSTDQKKKSMTC